MKTIETTNYKTNAHGVFYMDIYHPWHGGSNPNFNDFSSKILSFKNGKPEGLTYFKDLWYEKQFYDGDYTIVNVPSSDPANQATHGTRLFLDKIFSNSNVKLIKNGSDCLVRTVKVKKSVSGNRSIEKHLESIAVKKAELIRGRTVVILDDVTTTGNSLRACQQILEKAGCKKVVLVALAQTA